MSNILTIGYVTEGTTDKRFLGSVIKRTFDEIAFTCENDIEVFDPVFLKSDFKNSYIETTINIARKAYEIGLHVLCVHVDADDDNDKNVHQNKIAPSFKAIQSVENEICNNLVAIIPVRMSEAWMLADLELLKDEIGTQKTNDELQIKKNVEEINDPKAVIENALRISQGDLPRRRNRLTINELYQPIGQLISIEKLNDLESFRKFKEGVVAAFVTLNYLH